MPPPTTLIDDHVATMRLRNEQMRRQLRADAEALHAALARKPDWRDVVQRALGNTRLLLAGGDPDDLDSIDEHARATSALARVTRTPGRRW